LTYDFEAGLEVFVKAGVEFILVGGVSAVAQGAPVSTFDLDLVHARSPENIDRLLTVLEAMHAIFRMQPSRRLKPNRSHLSGFGHLNLMTDVGPIDLLCTIGRNLTYEDLLPDTDQLELGQGLTVRVLRLEKLIDLKEQLNSEKDRAMLPILRRTLEEKRRSGR